MSHIDQNKWDGRAAIAACADHAKAWRKQCAQSFDKQQQAESEHDEKMAIYWHNEAKAANAQAADAQATANIYRDSSYAKQYQAEIAHYNSIAAKCTARAISATIRAKVIEITQLIPDAELQASESDYWDKQAARLRDRR